MVCPACLEAHTAKVHQLDAGPILRASAAELVVTLGDQEVAQNEIRQAEDAVDFLDGGEGDRRILDRHRCILQ